MLQLLTLLLEALVLLNDGLILLWLKTQALLVLKLQLLLLQIRSVPPLLLQVFLLRNFVPSLLLLRKFEAHPDQLILQLHELPLCFQVTTLRLDMYVLAGDSFLFEA